MKQVSLKDVSKHIFAANCTKGDAKEILLEKKGKLLAISHKH
jgi:hypothetical protein